MHPMKSTDVRALYKAVHYSTRVTQSCVHVIPVVHILNSYFLRIDSRVKSTVPADGKTKAIPPVW